MIEEKKKQNPYAKRNRIEARVDNEEMQEILTKAQLYTRGDVSKLIRLALKTYRPTKKVTK